MGNTLLKDKEIAFKTKNKKVIVKLWIKYSKKKNKTPAEEEFIQYLKNKTI